MSADEQEINPSNMKRKILTNVMRREAERKKNMKVRETGDPLDTMEKVFINTFQFKDLNEVPHAARMQGLLQAYPQSPQQFLTLYKSLQKESLKDIQNITMDDLDVRYSTIIKMFAKEQRINDILPAPGLRQYPSTKHSNSVLQSTLTPRQHKLEATWTVKTKALFMTQETPPGTSQSDDKLLDNLEVLVPQWESLFYKYFFTRLRHQPLGTQKGSLWPYFPWARSSHWCNFCIPEFRSSNIPSRCNHLPDPITFPWGDGSSLCHHLPA